MSNSPSPESASTDPAAVARDFAQSIIDTIREPLLVLDADLRVKSASRSFYQVFGVTPEETKGRLVYELGNGQWNIPRLRTLLEEILPKENSFRDFEVDHVFEGIGRRRMLLNGRKVWTPENHSELILLAIEDITERWRAGVAFGDSRERYRVIVEGATSYAIFTVDMQGIVTTWNAGAEEMLGYSEAEMVGRDFRIIFTPEDIEAGLPETEMRAAEAEGQALDERWHLKKGGELFWANGLLMPLKDDTDQTRGFLKVVRDMTEQKNLEEALRRRTADLERADVQKNQFLAMLAHELRNPLAAIRNAVTVSALSSDRRAPRLEPRGHHPPGRQLRPPHRRPPGRLPHHGREDSAPQGTHRRDPHPPKRHGGRETAHRTAEARTPALGHVHRFAARS